MAHFLDEGSSSTGTSSNVLDTNEWLKANNLSHLIPQFAQNEISISELSQMSRDDLTEVLDALGINKINLPRIRSKIMKLKNNNNNNNNQSYYHHQQQQSKPHRVIITESETAALNSLDVKYKELTLQQKSVENRLNEFEKEYIKQQNLLNSAFNEISANIEKRKNMLLNEMKQKSQEYKQKLKQQKQSVANQRSVLSQIKNKCEGNINKSSATSISAAQQRANKNVKLINKTLLSVKQHTKYNKMNQNINVKFDIANSKINNNIKQWGDVFIVGDKPPPPKINFVKRSGYQMTVELLCDENYTQSISKYEINYNISTKYRSHHVFAGLDDFAQNDDEKQPKNELVTVTNDENVAFYNLEYAMQRMQTVESIKYKVRCRAILKHGQKGEYSEWSVITYIDNTSPPPRMGGRASLRLQQKQYINMSEWYQFCNTNKISLTSHQQSRIFYYAEHQQSKPLGLSPTVQSLVHQQIPIGSVTAYNLESLIVDSEESMQCAEWKQMGQILLKWSQIGSQNPIYPNNNNHNNNNNNNSLW